MGAGISLAGKMAAGSVQNGNKALVMPAGEQGLVKGNASTLFLGCNHSQERELNK